MSSSDEYDGRSQRMRATPQHPQHALGRVGRGARAYQILQRLRAPVGSSAAEIGTSSRSLVPGRVALSYARKYGVSGASTKSGPPLCAS